MRSNINMQSINNFLQSKRFMTIVTFLGLFLIATGISWAAFTFLGKSGPSLVAQGGIGGARSKLNLNLPKTEICPINGAKFTVAERNIWETRRPITMMVENHVDSRPPNGLSKADFFYETVAEGGITRFLAVFYCGVAAEDVKVAPVRSARFYFIDWASEYGDNPIFAHVGGANNFCADCPGQVKPFGTTAKEVRAIEMLETIGWRVPGGNDFDTSYDSGYPVFYRDAERNKDIAGHLLATEHTMVASTDEMYKEAEKRGFGAKDSNGAAWDKDFTQYKFVDDAKLGSPTATDITFGFWSSQPDYNVEWKYDSANNQYLRFDGGKAHVDVGYNNTQLTAKNIVVMKIKETGPVDEEGHMMEQNIGTGEMTLFQNGTVIKGTWSKADRTARTIFKDENGKEPTLVRGVTWVEAIPSDNTVTYK